jgi:microcystin-dependent protein
MSDPFLAEIRMFGGGFTPSGWAQCNGQLIPIPQNTALFSLLGTTYGGDGKNTYALPNLQGSAPIGAGTGAGLSQRFLGDTLGTPSVTLLTSEMPGHQHTIAAYGDDLADVNTPSDGVILGASSGLTLYAKSTFDTTMNAQALSPTGGNQPHNNLMPFLAVNFIIATRGIFPPRP